MNDSYAVARGKLSMKVFNGSCCLLNPLTVPVVKLIYSGAFFI